VTWDPLVFEQKQSHSSGVVWNQEAVNSETRVRLEPFLSTLNFLFLVFVPICGCTLISASLRVKIWTFIATSNTQVRWGHCTFMI
jgi:hypothetical protein